MQDIVLLAEHFLKENCLALGKQMPRLSPQAKCALQNYSYPGNVRELENIIQRATILCQGSTIEPEHLPDDLTAPTIPSDAEKSSGFPTFRQAKEELVNDFERQYLLRVLHESGGVIKKAAEIAGMHTKNFHQKLAKYHIRSKDLKSA